MIQFPRHFEQTLAELGSAPRVSAARQTQALRELFDLFTRARSQLGRRSYLDQPHLRSAYLQYHLPLNVARSMYVLSQIRERHAALEKLRTIVDLGGGPGTATWATLLSVPTMEGGELRVYDQSAGAIQLGEAIWKRCREHFPGCDVRFHKQSLPALPVWRGPALVWLAMVLNELLRHRRFDVFRFADSLTQRCEPGSVLVITEPALRQPGRDLLKLHDLLLEMGDWQMIAPCTHQLACPLLAARDRSWCHFRFSWRVPAAVQRVAAPLNLECERPSVAYLALLRVENGSATNSSPEQQKACASEARVIGDPMAVQSGGLGVYICHQGERRLLSPVPSATARGDVIIQTQSRSASQSETPEPRRKKSDRSR